MVMSRKVPLFIAVCFGISVRLVQGQDSRSVPSALVERSPQEFHDPVSGSTSVDLVRRALSSNADLAAARLDVERARGRLRQAGLFPKPTLDVEQTTGRWTGSPDEKGQNIGVTVPLELGGKRGRRIDVAQAEFEAAQAEVADRERRLTADVRLAYADALAALRELEVTSDLNAIDQQTAQFVQVRVTEGDAPPLELNLLRAEVDRLRSRRALVQGRLEAAVLKLKSLTAISVPLVEDCEHRRSRERRTVQISFIGNRVFCLTGSTRPLQGRHLRCFPFRGAPFRRLVAFSSST